MKYIPISKSERERMNKGEVLEEVLARADGCSVLTPEQMKERLDYRNKTIQERSEELRKDMDLRSLSLLIYSQGYHIACEALKMNPPFKNKDEEDEFRMNGYREVIKFLEDQGYLSCK